VKQVGFKHAVRDREFRMRRINRQRKIYDYRKRRVIDKKLTGTRT